MQPESAPSRPASSWPRHYSVSRQEPKHRPMTPTHSQQSELARQPVQHPVTGLVEHHLRSRCHRRHIRHFHRCHHRNCPLHYRHHNPHRRYHPRNHHHRRSHHRRRRQNHRSLQARQNRGRRGRNHLNRNHPARNRVREDNQNRRIPQGRDIRIHQNRRNHRDQSRQTLRHKSHLHRPSLDRWPDLRRVSVYVKKAKRKKIFPVVEEDHDRVFKVNKTVTGLFGNVILEWRWNDYNESSSNLM